MSTQSKELAMRSNEGKTKLSYALDMPYAIEEKCRVFEKGAIKYERDNWKKGRLVRESIDSLLRHLRAFQNGEDVDADTGCLHIAMVGWNADFILETLSRHPELDDRDKSLYHTTTTNEK